MIIYIAIIGGYLLVNMINAHNHYLERNVMFINSEYYRGIYYAFNSRRTIIG